MNNISDTFDSIGLLYEIDKYTGPIWKYISLLI